MKEIDIIFAEISKGNFEANPNTVTVGGIKFWVGNGFALYGFHSPNIPFTYWEKVRFAKALKEGRIAQAVKGINHEAIKETE